MRRAAGSSAAIWTTFERTGLAEFIELVAEGGDTIEFAAAAGNSIMVGSLHDASPVLRRYALDGTVLGTVPITGGAVTGLFAEADCGDVLVGMSSVTSPTVVFRIDPADGSVRALPELVAADAGEFVPPEIRVERHRARVRTEPRCRTSWSCRPASARMRPRPTLLWGYGGFKVPIAADYRPGWSGWLSAGGVLAIANLRGGGEFGTEWYEAGRLSAKQNVFDDFIGVAEDLIGRGVTTPEQLAIHGRSNGGLLVGAAITQRPDLFAAAVPAVGVLDLLRFHLFTVGAAWMSDYGDPDDPGQFADALAYSPLHTGDAGNGLSADPGADRRP